MPNRDPYVTRDADEGPAPGLGRAGADLLLEVLTTIVEQAPDVRGCGVPLRRPGWSGTVGCCGDLARAGEDLLHELGQGPGVQALTERVVVAVGELAGDRRWGTYPRTAVASGIRAVHCLPVPVDDAVTAVLTLYSGVPAGLDGLDRARAAAWAGRVGGVLVMAERARRHVQELTQALLSRTAIGRATGLVMAQVGCSAEVALDALKRQSQHTNRKLRDIATELVAKHEAAALPTIAAASGRPASLGGEQPREVLVSRCATGDPSGWSA